MTDKNIISPTRTIISDHTIFTGKVHVNKDSHWFTRDKIVISVQYCKYKRIAKYQGNDVSSAEISYKPSMKYFKDLNLKETSEFLKEHGDIFKIMDESYELLNKFTDRKLKISVNKKAININALTIFETMPFSDAILNGYFDSILSHEPIRLKLVKRA